MDTILQQCRTSFLYQYDCISTICCGCQMYQNYEKKRYWKFKQNGYQSSLSLSSVVIFVNQGDTSIFRNRLQQMLPSDVVKCVAQHDIIKVRFPPPQQKQLNLEACNNTSISKSSSLQHHDVRKKSIKYSIGQQHVYSNNKIDTTFLMECQGDEISVSNDNTCYQNNISAIEDMIL